MAKSMSLRELLTKLSYVFPDDIYIIGNHYVIEGEKSSKRNCGTNTVILTDKVGELLNEKFDKKYKGIYNLLFALKDSINKAHLKAL